MKTSSAILAVSAASSLARAADTSTATAAPELEITPIGWVEASYTYDFARPSNRIVNVRGFDNRHDSITLENVVAGAQLRDGPIGAKLLLQVGATPSTYYLAEPALPGSGGANTTNPELWKYVQEAFATWTAPIGDGLTFQVGLCVSPIGAEVIPVKDNWNWSRSNLFFGLPFYHTGARVSYPVVDRLTLTLSIFNGWNSVVDNNGHKSFSASLGWTIPDRLVAQLLYFGGVERADGAAEGEGWRHDFDAYALVNVTSWLSLLGHVNGGFEPTELGTASWIAGALYARAQLSSFLYLAARGDIFQETVPSGAAAIFWSGADWVASGTATIELRPADHLSARLEYRHDEASAPLFFRDTVTGDGGATPFAPNAERQDTLTLGVTAWF